MHFNLKQLAKKYDLTISNFDDMYYETFRVVKNLSGSKINEELMTKFLSDKLEENGIGYRDIERIVEYYVNDPEADDVENNDIEEDEGTQTSSNTGIDASIGMNKKSGYKTKVRTPYE